LLRLEAAHVRSDSPRRIARLYMRGESRLTVPGTISEIEEEDFPETL